MTTDGADARGGPAAHEVDAMVRFWRGTMAEDDFARLASALSAARADRDHWKSKFEESNQQAVRAALEFGADMAAARARADQAETLLGDFVDGVECEFRGNYCMEHHARAREGECPNAIARKFLALAAPAVSNPIREAP